MPKIETKGEKLFNTVNITFLTFLSIITLYPFLYVVGLSFSSSYAISSGQVVLWPVEFNLRNYAELLAGGQIYGWIRNSFYTALVGTGLALLGTTMASYALSKRRLKGRNFFLMMITFTMLFHGGIIPSFILIKNLNLMNSYWAIWLPGLVSTYYMFVMKTSFESMPDSLEESASIDGANDLTIMLRIILPLQLPMLASLTLFFAVNAWNSYQPILFYITKTEKQTLMYRLQVMLTEIRQRDMGLGSQNLEDIVTPEGLKTASVVVATVPILCVYPFLQKYFTKGVMIGAIKG